MKKKKINNADDTGNIDATNEEINLQVKTEINKDKNIIEKLDDKKDEINDGKVDANIDSKINEETNERDYSNINNKNKEQEKSNNLSNESIKKEDQKVDKNNSKTDELIKRLSEKEKRKKNNNPEPLNESKLELFKFFMRSPDFFKFIKSLIHQPFALQFINNSPQMQQLIETDPEVFKLMNNTEFMDEFLSPENFKTFHEIPEIDKNKDKIDKNTILNLIIILIHLIIQMLILTY